MPNILREIGKIARGLDSISNIEFKDVNLSRGQYVYLVRICEHPGIIQEKLAELIMVDRTTTARAIKRLEASGFVERRGDSENRKIRKLFPTKRALEVYPFIIRENIYSNQVVLAGLSTKEAEILADLLVKVRENVEVDWELVKKGHKREY
ncbi:MarR family winged helix-turn-helix transcriptional regulator [Culicoidibacter larvae]|uniref:MarR family transcriptional regulator n=1 Tax=Culicoidibacter larvae TaxID=2579976 RepID=A0A5R8Q8S7_9FIRM|nr:MarR family transcriptional regulator [Culicoidibacter larvae]